MIVSIISIGRPCFTIGRPNSDRTGKVFAETPEQEKFTDGLHTRALGQIVPHMPFGQEIGEERQQAHVLRTKIGRQFTKLVFEAEAQNRALSASATYASEKAKSEISPLTRVSVPIGSP